MKAQRQAVQRNEPVRRFSDASESVVSPALIDPAMTETLMDIFLDDVKVEFPLPEAETLEAAVRRLQAQVCPPDRVVVGVRCDGINLTGEELIEAMARPASGYGCIELATALPAVLVRDALTQAADLLAEADHSRENVAELLSQGRNADGMGALSECLAAWQQVNDAITRSILMLGLDASAVRRGAEPLEVALKLPVEKLQMVRDALLAQDFVLLADVLQYEFGEVIDKWQAVVAAIRQLAIEAAGTEEGT